MQKKTTSAAYLEMNPGGLQLPSVTLCPGFKPGVFESSWSRTYPHILKLHGRNKSKPTTAKEVEEWWLNSTYSLIEGILAN